MRAWIRTWPQAAAEALALEAEAWRQKLRDELARQAKLKERGWKEWVDGIAREAGIPRVHRFCRAPEPPPDLSAGLRAMAAEDAIGSKARP